MIYDITLHTYHDLLNRFEIEMDLFFDKKDFVSIKMNDMPIKLYVDSYCFDIITKNDVIKVDYKNTEEEYTDSNDILSIKNKNTIFSHHLHIERKNYTEEYKPYSIKKELCFCYHPKNLKDIITKTCYQLSPISYYKKDLKPCNIIEYRGKFLHTSALKALRVKHTLFKNIEYQFGTYAESWDSEDSKLVYNNETFTYDEYDNDSYKNFCLTIKNYSGDDGELCSKEEFKLLKRRNILQSKIA